jgi:hypothetical protein
MTTLRVLILDILASKIQKPAARLAESGGKLVPAGHFIIEIRTIFLKDQ